MGLSVSPSFIIPTHTESFGLGRQLPVTDYLDRLQAYVEAAERVGFVGAFIYDFPAAMDPWLAAIDLLEHSTRLQPIVAVRPHTEVAESLARRLVDLRYRYGRPVHVNLVSGATGSARSAADLADPGAARRRLADYAADLRAELRRRAGASGAGTLVFTPASRTPGRVGADCVLTTARPRAELARTLARIDAAEPGSPVAVLVGTIARETSAQAWAAAGELYPDDRRLAVASRLFRAQLLSSEHVERYRFADEAEVHDEVLWYGASAGAIDAPKLVGSVEDVTRWLVDCIDDGATELIIDLPPNPEEFVHIAQVLDLLPDTPRPRMR
jgi:alkanesulfonate monooxygenase